MGGLPNIYMPESRYKMILTETNKTIIPSLHAEIWMTVMFMKKHQLYK